MALSLLEPYPMLQPCPERNFIDSGLLDVFGCCRIRERLPSFAQRLQVCPSPCANAPWRVRLRFYFGSFLCQPPPGGPGLQKSGAAQQLWYLQRLQCGAAAAACTLRRLRRAPGTLTAQISGRERLGMTRAKAHMLTSVFAQGRTRGDGGNTHLRLRMPLLNTGWHGGVFATLVSRYQAGADSL